MELEVSRADPVANHAKFATAHLFEPQHPNDVFVSMVSPYVDRGRRNLSSNTIALMRRLGMNAFQTVLLPRLTRAEIVALNELETSAIAPKGLDVDSEIHRAITVAEPTVETDGHRIHFVGDLLEVFLNARQWNREMAELAGRAAWGRRTIRYFVGDPRSLLFAPSKFCAFVALAHPSSNAEVPATKEPRAHMTVAVYSKLEGTDSRFDGTRARNHLTNALAMVPRTLDDVPSVTAKFQQWLTRHEELITVHPGGATLLLPPLWFSVAGRT
jgi:hypothetical protein